MSTATAETPETSVTVPALNKTQAGELVKQIQTGVEGIGKLIVDLHDGRGWEALGYRTWGACCKAEFRNKTSHIYRLMDTENVIKEIGEPVTEGVARELKKVPKGKKIAVLAKAKATAAKKGKAPTAEDVKKEAKKSTPANPVAALEKELDQETEKAVRRIGAICGSKVETAIRDNTLGLTIGDIRLWASLRDTQVKELSPLIVDLRWNVKGAVRAIAREFGPDTTAEEMKNRAISRGGSFTVRITGFDFTVSKVK